jgi:hypothetical protein
MIFAAILVCDNNRVPVFIAVSVLSITYFVCNIKDDNQLGTQKNKGGPQKSDNSALASSVTIN